MTADEIRRKYLEFFVARGHAAIEPSPLVPVNDPTTLFTSSGMQQLVPNLKGEPHPMGTRLVDSQPSFRAEDIDEVGDNRHTTFFEMLGNWSLGDYFKREQLPWCWEFLTKELSLDPARLHVTVFEGFGDIPKDTEAYEIWRSLGVPDTHIHYYNAKKNWWSRSGTPDKMPAGEIGGPDSEVFYDFGPDLRLHENSPWKDEPCHVNCDCGRYVEIGNSVFMQYIKKDDGTFEPLPKANVDFGGGLERITAAAQKSPDIFMIDLFEPARKELEKLSNVAYGSDAAKDRSFRVILDHLRAAVMMIAEGLLPSNKQQGYILRRLIRRAVFHGRLLEIASGSTSYHALVEAYAAKYPHLASHVEEITGAIESEAKKFETALDRGMRTLRKALQSGATIDGKFMFDLYQTEGFPLELTLEILAKEGKVIGDADRARFAAEFEKHRDLSRTAAAGMFKGGLADQSEEVTKLHTATHLIHAALRKVLGVHVHQEGSNITSERLRFDFSHPRPMTDEEIGEVEAIVNEAIRKDYPVAWSIMDKNVALEKGAMAFFREKYPDKVKVYTIGAPNNWFSMEFCGGPHVASTGIIGGVTIKKEEGLGAGKRRLYAVLS